MNLLTTIVVATLLQGGGRTAQPLTTIDKGSSSAIETPREATARTPAEWAALWQAHSGDRPLPAVDFARDMVVGVFMGTQPTGGFAVEIVGTRQDHGSLVVEYRETRPGRDTITAQIITAPFHLVAIPAFSGEVIFQKVKS
jgi:protease stability complex PrcB-like protein